jgi:hypothetical protein
LINPPAQGVQNVMDRYAEQLLDAIQRDGFFVRVPAGKLFYVYVTDDLDTGKATVRGANRLHEVQEQFLEDRKLQEKVTEPRSTRDTARTYPTPPPYVPIDPAITQRLDRTGDLLNQKTQQLQEQTQQFAQPSPAP